MALQQHAIYVELQEAILDQIAVSSVDGDTAPRQGDGQCIEREFAWKGYCGGATADRHGVYGTATLDQNCDDSAILSMNMIDTVGAQRSLLAGVNERWPCLASAKACVRLRRRR